jgi:hypothetical protein
MFYTFVIDDGSELFTTTIDRLLSVSVNLCTCCRLFAASGNFVVLLFSGDGVAVDSRKILTVG